MILGSGFQDGGGLARGDEKSFVGGEGGWIDKRRLLPTTQATGRIFDNAKNDFARRPKTR